MGDSQAKRPLEALKRRGQRAYLNTKAPSCGIFDRVCPTISGVTSMLLRPHSSTWQLYLPNAVRIVLAAIFGVACPASADDSIESKCLSNIRQVTSGFVRAGEGYFSPDGQTIIYQAVPKDYPFYQIYTQPLAGGKPQAAQHRPRPHDVQLLLARRQADPVRLAAISIPSSTRPRRPSESSRPKTPKAAAAGATSGTSTPTWTSSRPISTARTCGG